MKNKIFFIAASALFIYACGGTVRNPTKPDIAKDTLTYTYKKLNARADDCGSKPDSACTTIDISYPEFKNAAKLNDTLKYGLITLAAFSEKPDTSFKLVAEKFIKAYKDDKKLTDRKGMFYTNQTNAVVVRQDSSLVTLQVTNYHYTGGTHGGTETGFINWDIDQKKWLHTTDIFVEGFLPKLNAIAEKIFRKNENLSDTASLSRDYFFDKGKFSVNQNFLITPLGIRYLYNQYEIKPYAAGQTNLVIPYAAIKSLLKPNTVVSQYIH